MLGFDVLLSVLNLALGCVGYSYGYLVVNMEMFEVTWLTIISDPIQQVGNPVQSAFAVSSLSEPDYY